MNLFSLTPLHTVLKPRRVRGRREGRERRGGEGEHPWVHQTLPPIFSRAIWAQVPTDENNWCVCLCAHMYACGYMFMWVHVPVSTNCQLGRNHLKKEKSQWSSSFVFFYQVGLWACLGGLDFLLIDVVFLITSTEWNKNRPYVFIWSQKSV